MSEESDVFISYARSTADRARQIAGALRASGFTVWYDEDLPAHGAFSDVIEEHLRDAKAVIVIWSAEAVKSEWVRAEADTARQTRKLIQLRVDNTSLPLPFSQIQCVDLAGWSGDIESPSWRKIVASVEELVGRTSPSSITTANTSTRPRLPFPGWVWAVSAVASLFLLAVVAGLYFEWGSRGTAPSIQSIAVLPLDNYSGSSSEEYFADGMTDELTTALATISKLRVISRSSVMRFKGDNRPPAPQIASLLNVDALIEGSVVRAEGKVRITVQLIDARADKHLWAGTLERDAGNVLSLQDELASAIARQVDIELTPGEQARLSSTRTVIPAAHDAYLKGRYFLARPSDDNLRTAIAEFGEATRLDPTFAAAYSGLADAYTWAGGNEGFITSSAAMSPARAAAEKAVALDPNSSEAHASLAAYKGFYEFDWSGSERELRRAIALNPNYAYAHDQLGQILGFQGRLNEAIAEGKRAIALDPLSPQVAIDATLYYAWQRNYSAARDIANRVLKLDPTFFGGHGTLGWIDVQEKRYREAVSEYEATTVAGAPSNYTGWLGYAYAMSGDRARALKTIDVLKTRPAANGFIPPFNLALVYLGLGDRDRALDCLEQAYTANSQWLPWLKMDVAYDPLRKEPRFKALLKKLHFES